jgi:hypothetical protein
VCETGDNGISDLDPAKADFHIFIMVPASREEMKASLRLGTNLLWTFSMASLPPGTKPTAYCAVRQSLSERYVLIHRDRQGTVCAKIGTSCRDGTSQPTGVFLSQFLRSRSPILGNSGWATSNLIVFC